MRAVHQDERDNRAKRSLSQMKAAVASGVDPESDDEPLLQYTTVTSGSDRSMDWGNTEDSNQEILPYGLEKGSGSSYSMLDIFTSPHAGLSYTSHMDYPNQPYLLDHCKSNILILALQICVLAYEVSCILHPWHGKQQTYQF